MPAPPVRPHDSTSRLRLGYRPVAARAADSRGNQPRFNASSACAKPDPPVRRVDAEIAPQLRRVQHRIRRPRAAGVGIPRSKSLRPSARAAAGRVRPRRRRSLRRSRASWPAGRGEVPVPDAREGCARTLAVASAIRGRAGRRADLVGDHAQAIALGAEAQHGEQEIPAARRIHPGRAQDGVVGAAGAGSPPSPASLLSP